MSTLDAPARDVVPIPGAPPRLLVIEAPYYAAIVGGMRAAALTAFAAAKATSETVAVAGAFELPAALRCALNTRPGWDGVLLLGCIVEGETDHYRFICEAVCQGVMAITAETGAAVGFGLLTVATLAQAEARSAADRHNKGAEAAHALLGQVALRRHWGIAS